MLINTVRVAYIYECSQRLITAYVARGLIPHPTKINNILHWELADIWRSRDNVMVWQKKCEKRKGSKQLGL